MKGVETLASTMHLETYLALAHDAHEVAQEYPPDDLDQTPPSDPAEPDPIPDDDFDQSRGD